jgi:hypothetical protein
MKASLFLALLLFSLETNAQRKKFDSKKYFDCLAHINIDFSKPKKYFDESTKYLDTELILVITDNQGHAISIERGFIKNSKNQKDKSIWFESKSLKDSTKTRIWIENLEQHNGRYYYADCFEKK